MAHQVERLADAQKPNSWVLRLEGDATIASAAQLKDAMLKAASECSHLFLDCTKLTAIDLSVVQLICSLHLTLAAEKKTLGFLAPPPSCLTDILNKAGLIRTTGCRPECGETCLWNGESGR